MGVSHLNQLQGFRWEAVCEARNRLQGVARRTPLLRAQDITGGPALYLKAECFQRTHAFKFRGAYNRSRLLPEENLRRGLVTASSGNHALGLSLAGSIIGAAVTVVMPLGAPKVKEAGCRRYGAEVVRFGEAYDDAVSYAKELAAEKGFTYVQSFDDPLVAAGQATVAWEILEDLPDVETIVAPIGGGGLLSGLLGFVKLLPQEEAARLFPARRRPLAEINVIGVQAEGAASTIRSIEAGRRLELPAIATIADGIAVRQPGEWTYEFISRHADGFLTVTDEAMLAALGDLATKEKLVAEPAGAAAVAAVLGGGRTRHVDLGEALHEGRAIACVISGGNVEPELLSRCVAISAERR